MKNPKLIDSNIVECKPQIGPCENNCNQCYYNRSDKYKAAAIIPNDTGKIVRMNAGHDSNIQREKVIATSTLYKDVFFNTSIARFDFPGPVVFTANSVEEEKAILVMIPKNLMFVRLRVSATNLDLVQEAIIYYTERLIPVVLTYMAYYTHKPAGPYEWKKRNINSYWCPKESFKKDTLLTLGNRLVFNCGQQCADCGNCETLYRLCKCS